MAIDNRQIFSANLTYYMTINNIKRPQLAEALNVNYFTLCDWVNGKKYPRPEKIDKLAAFFGISKADLIEQHNNDGSAHLLNVYRSLNETGQQKLIGYADDLAASGNYKKSDTVSDIAE